LHQVEGNLIKMPVSNHLDSSQCSLLILLATQAEEDGLTEAAQACGLGFEKRNHPELGRYFWFGRVGAEIVIASRPWRESGRAVMGPHGRLGTAARGINLRNKTETQGIIQLGMAFGVDYIKQRLGDVVVSRSLIPYDDRTIASDPDNPNGYRTDYGQALAQPARRSLVDLFEAEAERNQRSFNVHIGAILSGSARIHSRKFRDELVFGVPHDPEEIVGGEMEGVGLLAASTAADKPIWCVVKGISDFGDENRGMVIDQGRVLACRNAAEFVLAALQNGPLGP